MRKLSLILTAAAGALFVLLAVRPFKAAGYLTDADRAVNRVRIGVNTLTPLEDYEEPEPGRVTVKNPRAANDGIIPCYVRAKVLLSDSRIDLRYGEYLNTADWTWSDTDGWYYYRTVLEPGETTTALFDRILLAAPVPDTVAEAELNVIFSSVQSAGFSDAQEAFAALKTAQN